MHRTVATLPYYSDDSVTLYHGDCRELLPAMAATGMRFDCAVTDPPYGETSLAWDRWPDGWPAVVATLTSSMWCFGSLRMFLDRRDEFSGWKLSQDIIWDKRRSSGFVTDRFKRIHEHVVHWYRGNWRSVHHTTPRMTVNYRTQGNSLPSYSGQADHYTGGKRVARSWLDDGTRLAQSIIPARTMWRRGAIHPTEKPVEIIAPLVEYACPPAGLVLDPFAGSGSTGEAACLSGRGAVLIEADERYCERIARRLAARVLPIEGV